MTLLDGLYLCAAAALSPWILFKLLFNFRWRHRVSERFGAAPRAPKGNPRIWFHASSVGEVSLLPPVISELRKRHPDLVAGISTMTRAGRERASALFPDSPVFYFPIDLSFITRRALRRFDPDAITLAELEVWPNFISAADRRHIPIAIINGRVSDRAFGRYRFMSAFFRPLFHRVSLLLAQNGEYADRLRILGGGDVRSTGNLKFDVPVPFDVAETGREFRSRLGLGEAPVLVAGSTHDPEERLLLEAFRDLRASHPSLRLVLAPRHVERAAEVEKMIVASGYRCYKTSLFPDSPSEPGVILVDRVGELMKMYAVASVVFIGGTFSDRGGQNMLEPAALGRPVVSGPGVANFRDAAGALVRGGGMSVVEQPSSLAGEIGRLLGNSPEAVQMGERAKRVVESGRGALQNTVSALEEMMRGRIRTR